MVNGDDPTIGQRIDPDRDSVEGVINLSSGLRHDPFSFGCHPSNEPSDLLLRDFQPSLAGIQNCPLFGEILRRYGLGLVASRIYQPAVTLRIEVLGGLIDLARAATKRAIQSLGGVSCP